MHSMWKSTELEGKYSGEITAPIYSRYTYRWDCHRGRSNSPLHFPTRSVGPTQYGNIWCPFGSKHLAVRRTTSRLSISSSFVGRSRLKAMPVKAATLPNGGLDNGQIGRECLVVDGAYISLISKRLVLTVSVFRLTLLCALTGGTSIYLCHSLGLALRLVSSSDS
jgi:hypothetical protein